MLNPEERKQVVNALWDWAKSAPNEAMVGVLGGHRLLTPGQIARHVEEDSEEGRAVLEILEHGVRCEGIAAVIARLSARVTV